ncbi:MAG: response regulator [Candidatus Aminicenantes bacterium]|nr:response regulator [Candidatus Aminicenantes bacterium]
MRILIIDGDPVNLKLIRTVFESGGHEVIAADSVPTALQTVFHAIPEFIVMDVQPGDMGDSPPVGHLKNDPRFQSVPVAAVTALAMKNDRERILQAGFDYYLAKPIRYRELLDLVEQINTEKRY